jgi:hypothetical protein
MTNTASRPKIIVPADGPGIVSQAGALLLTQVLQVTGVSCSSRQTPPRGLARFILLLDVRGGGLDDC